MTAEQWKTMGRGTGAGARVVLMALSLTMVPGVLAAQDASRSDRPAATGSATSGETGTPAAQSPAKNEQEIDEAAEYKHSSVVKMLGSKMGMSTEQAATAFELFNFVVLAIGVVYLLAKILPGKFRDRTSLIQKRLVEARAATEEASARLNGVEARLGKLDEQISGLRAQAEKDLEAEEQRVRASIEDERKKILAAAEQEIGSATVQARRQLQQFAAELAVDQAAKRLVVTAETDRLLIREFAGKLTGKGGGQN